MGRLILILISSCFYLHSAASDSTINFTIAKTLQGKFKNFEIDNLHNYYVVNNANQIIKYNDSFDSIGSFNNAKPLGNITSIDVSNPFKILVFYKAFSTILVLDKFLNVVNTIQLQKQNLFDVNAITNSYDNNIWLFDEIENKVKKVNIDGKAVTETIDFRLLFDYDKEFIVDFIKDYEGKLYIYSNANGLFIFDYYGSFIKKIAATNYNQAFIHKGNLIGITTQNQLESIEIATKKVNTLFTKINWSDVLKYKFFNNDLVVLDKEKINVHKRN